MTLSDNGLPAIGGYFELELPDRQGMPHISLQCFQSARAAFIALLRAGRPAKVWMPRFICNAMLAPLEKSGIDYAWYDLTDELEVRSEVRLGSDEWLLYVNYFGICGAKVDALLHRFSSTQIVLDYSQAFYAPPRKEALATIYSPRKFFGVPDGGFLHTQLPISMPEVVDETSYLRMEHLMRRLVDSPESGYSAYQDAEESLCDLEPRRMSRLTERILSSIDFESARKKRIENFMILHEKLGGGGTLNAIDENAVPLVYPYRTTNPDLRQHLINNRIFVATYWSDALERLNVDEAEKFIHYLLPLPIDQRYNKADMERLVSVIKNS